MANPTLREDVFHNEIHNESYQLEKPMTINGTLFKTLILGAFVALSASYTWYLQLSGFVDKANILAAVGGIGGLITCLIVCFTRKGEALKITVPIYALFEGLFLGSISALFNSAYPGIVSQAVIGTLFTILGMYLLYAGNIIKVNETFWKVVLISTFSVFGIYLLQFILALFHVNIPHLFSNSPIGIGFSVVVCAVAALNLILDFEIINRFSNSAPKYMEWYGAFSLMVTIVWLYVEMLKLLAKINSRR